MRKNATLALLRDGKVALGCWLQLHSYQASRMLAAQGFFEWLMVDYEHTPIDRSGAAQIMSAIADVSGGRVTPLARVATASVEAIKHALDAGAQGVIVPMIKSAAEVRAAVRYARYPPEGERGAGGLSPHLGFGVSRPVYIQVVNREILFGVQIETAEAVEDIEAILDVPGVDLCFIGPNDLHLALGYPAMFWSSEPRFAQAVERVKAACVRRGIPLGTLCKDVSSAKARIREGYTFVGVGSDAHFVLQYAGIQYGDLHGIPEPPETWCNAMKFHDGPYQGSSAPRPAAPAAAAAAPGAVAAAASGAGAAASGAVAAASGAGAGAAASGAGAAASGAVAAAPGAGAAALGAGAAASGAGAAASGAGAGAAASGAGAAAPGAVAAASGAVAAASGAGAAASGAGAAVSGTGAAPSPPWGAVSERGAVASSPWGVVSEPGAGAFAATLLPSPSSSLLSSSALLSSPPTPPSPSPSSSSPPSSSPPSPSPSPSSSSSSSSSLSLSLSSSSPSSGAAPASTSGPALWPTLGGAAPSTPVARHAGASEPLPRHFFQTREFKFDPNALEFDLDPFPTYKYMRENVPVYWWAEAQGWVCTRYEDVLTLLRDRRFSVEIKDWEHGPADQPDERLTTHQVLAKHGLFWMPGMDHMRVRKVLGPLFSPRAVEPLRREFDAVAEEMVAPLEGRASFDLVADFTSKYPLRAITRVLGIPREKQERFVQFGSAVIDAFYPAISPEALREKMEFLPTGVGMLEEIMAEKRKQPDDGYFSKMVHAEDQGERLTSKEVISQVALMISAGCEPPRHLVTFAIRDLLLHPDQLALLRAEPGLLRNAIDEVGRFDSFGKLNLPRFPLEDVEIRGVRIPRGQQVFGVFASALRDPEVFPDPDAFDIRRDQGKSVLYGDGPHVCLGTWLAKLMAESATRALLRTFPSLKLAGPPTFTRNAFFRKIVSLPLERA